MDASRKTVAGRIFEVIDSKASSSAPGELYFRPDPWIAELVSRVEDKLESVTRSDNHLMDVIGRHMLFGYAKRLRPLFLMLGQLLFNENILEQTMNCAAASELIHCASLFHDDVIDGAAVRKGRRAANAVWGNKSAVIMGDHFFVLAYNLIAAQGDLKLIDIFIQTCKALADGVMLEIRHTGDTRITEETHLRIITRKTATFFADTAFIGGYVAGASPEQQAVLRDMGMNFGLAFQISDDLLDLYADPEATGKPRGTDISAGFYTTAIIHGLNHDPRFQRTFGPALTDDNLGPDVIDSIAGDLRTNGSLDYCRGLILNYCGKARECLGKLPGGKANDEFRALVDIIASREY
jgi:geranylgeranyl pyrophosphate synthase